LKTDVEAAEEGKQQPSQQAQAWRLPQSPQQAQLHQSDQRHRSQEHRAQIAAPLERVERGAQHEKRGHHRGQVDLPVRVLGQARLYQHRRDGHPHRQLHRVQHEHA